MVSYDQLNLPALASAEALNRRRALIEVAHQGRPEAPSYEAAEEIMGVRESVDGSVIDRALTQHAAKRQAAKAEVLKQTRLAAEERKHLRQRGDEDDRIRKGDGKHKDKDKIGAESFLSTGEVFHEPLARHGDPFPLPLPSDQCFAGRVGDLSSRRSRQRVCKRRMLVNRSRGTVWALNHLAGFDDESLWPSFVQNRAQAAVLIE